jgi:ADP-ribose pyrophosphatase
MQGWKRRPSQVVYTHGRFRVIEERWRVPGGAEVTFPILRSPSFAVVVGLTDDHKIPMVANRHPSPGLGLIELPAGRLDRGESPRTAARREFEEETGWKVGRLTRLGRYHPNPHWGTFAGHVFLGEKLSAGRPHLDPGESLLPLLLPVGEVYRRLHRGELLGGSTIVGLSLAEPRLRAMGFLPDAGPRRRAPRTG